MPVLQSDWIAGIPATLHNSRIGGLPLSTAKGVATRDLWRAVQQLRFHEHLSPVVGVVCLVIQLKYERVGSDI